MSWWRSLLEKIWIKDVRIALVVLCVYSVAYGMAMTYVGAVITTLEKRFNLISTDLGWIMGANDIGYLCFVIPIAYVASRRDKSLILCISGVGVWISCLLLALPYFIFGPKTTVEELLMTSSNTSSFNKNLCLLNDTLNQRQSTPGTDERTVKIVSFVIQMAGGILSGISSCPFWNAGVALLDDMAGDNSGFYLGILFATRSVSPILAFLFAGWSVRQHETLKAKSSDIPGGEMNPEWIGAWWFGWIVLGFSVLLTAPFMGMIKIKSQSQLSTESDLHTEETQAGEEKSDVQISQKKRRAGSDVDFAQLQNLKFKEMIDILVSLLKNPVYVNLLIGMVFEVTGLMSVFSFFPKFLTYYFRVSLSMSSILTAFSLAGSNVVSSLISGFVSKYVKFTLRQMNYYHFWANFISAILYVSLLFFPCSPTTIVGVNLDFEQNESLCRNNCSCKSVTAYSPVCFENRTFFSPCEAGCIGKFNKTTYEGCGCGQGPGVMGPCETVCTLVFGYLVVCFIVKVIGSIARVQFTTILMKQTSPNNKPIALALFGFLFGLLGLALPPLGGALFDMVCLIRNIENNTRSGYCLLYDNEKLRWVFNVFPLVMQFPACFFYFISWYKTPIEDEKGQNNGNIVK